MGSNPSTDIMNAYEKEIARLKKELKATMARCERSEIEAAKPKGIERLFWMSPKRPKLQKKQPKPISYVSFDEQPPEPATDKQMQAMRNLCRFVRWEFPEVSFTKEEASEFITDLLEEAKIRRKELGPRYLEGGPDEDYLYDPDDFYLDGWGDEFEH